MRKLKAIPFFDRIFAYQSADFTQVLADLIKESLKQKINIFVKSVDIAVDIKKTLKEDLKKTLNKFGNFELDLSSLQVPESIYKLFSRNTVLDLINYVLQVLYQQLWAYVDYYKIGEFDQKRQEVTTRTETEIQEANSKIQQTNTIMIKYGSAKSEDIDDLYDGKGKLLAGIANAMKNLKKLGEVNNSAQPIIFVVKEKKSKKGLFDWF